MPLMYGFITVLAIYIMCVVFVYAYVSMCVCSCMYMHSYMCLCTQSIIYNYTTCKVYASPEQD